MCTLKIRGVANILQTAGQICTSSRVFQDVKNILRKRNQFFKRLEFAMWK